MPNPVLVRRINSLVAPASVTVPKVVMLEAEPIYVLLSAPSPLPIVKYEKPDEDLTCKRFPLKLVFGALVGFPTFSNAPVKLNADPLVATLLPFRYNTPLAVPPERVKALLIVALVLVRLVIVADAKVAFVRDKLLMVRLVIRATVNEASAQVRLDGFVPSSITALAEVMENIRLSAVLTATSTPPAKLVRLAVPGTEPGVSLFFRRIVGISMLPRSGFRWR